MSETSDGSSFEISCGAGGSDWADDIFVLWCGDGTADALVVAGYSVWSSGCTGPGLIICVSAEEVWCCDTFVSWSDVNSPA